MVINDTIFTRHINILVKRRREVEETEKAIKLLEDRLNDLSVMVERTESNLIEAMERNVPVVSKVYALDLQKKVIAHDGMNSPLANELIVKPIQHEGR